MKRLAALAVIAAIGCVGATAHGGGTALTTYLQTWTGGPLQVNTTLFGAYTVPATSCLTIHRAVVLAEKHHGALPTGGELTTILLARLPGQTGWTNIAESSVETNNRVGYQGEGSLDLTLPPGSEIQAWVWLSNQAEMPANLGGIAGYFAEVSVAGDLTPC